MPPDVSARDPTAENFRAHLPQLRRARGLSVRALSGSLAEAGVRLLPSGITKIEQGERRVSLSEAVAISRALDMDLSRMVSSEPIEISVRA